MVGREGKTLLKTVMFLVEEESVKIPWVNLAQVIKNPSFERILETFVGNDDETEVGKSYENLRGVCGALKNSKYGNIDVSKIAVAYPEVLVLENGGFKVGRCLDFFVKTVGVDRRDVKKVIEKYPSLLGSSVTEMSVAMNFLINREVPDVEKVVRAFPNVLTIPRHKMQSVTTFLSDIGVVNVGRFIARIPPVLSYDVKGELKPRWEILRGEGMGSFEITRFPAFFSYPVNRIKCRYGFLRQKGISAKGLTIDDVLRGGDKDFLMMIGEGYEDYKEYEKNLRGGGNRGMRRNVRRGGKT